MKLLNSPHLVIAMAMSLAAADSDPAKTPPPPAGSIGFPDQSPSLNVLPGFKNPPPGYGIVPFYWWLGDPLTKERLSWQLEQMKGMGVSGYQINYAHSDKGGRSYGLTYPSEPALFSQSWWELVEWFKSEAGKQGAGISLSDYTLGFGQGYVVDELLRDHPEVKGMELRMDNNGKVVPETLPWSFNPMHPMSGKWYAERFFGQFEKRMPGEAGKGLNFFFSDELTFGVSGRLWSDGFADEFRKRKGYDIIPELASLFKDTGPRTPKVRLDYYDVLAALSEEGFFKPVFDWHQQRGMIMGCDHGGRGKRVDEFGDYFRTQRWNQGPGADQPGLGKDLIKAKVAASIAHLYKRPRVWLEGFYGSGWGTTSAGLIDATFANYAMGFNLLGLHGMYYSTHGGWWEWAPPDNTFRMPYWKHLKPFMDCQQRLAYLLSQGDYRCDVAILYPVAPVEAGMDGEEAVETAFGTARHIYSKGIDFDFMDFESLDRAKVVGKELHVAGNIYKVLVLPGMKAVRHSTLTKAAEFKRAGGLVLAVGAVPEASDRVGRDDPEVAALVRELFPDGPANDVPRAIPFRDYIGPGYIQHRKIGRRDVYAIYNAPKDSECFFRAKGNVERWDPWNGTTEPLPVVSQSEEGTKLQLPLTEKEMQLIVFSPGEPALVSQSTVQDSQSTISLDGLWEFELAPTLDNRFGDFHWPPTDSRIGAEARRLKYADETAADPGWQAPAFDDSKWPSVTCGFGPRFWKLGPLPDGVDADAALASIQQIDPAVPVRIAGKDYLWRPHEFSWRYGIENDCGHQGYHGLKIQVADEFIGLGDIRHGHPECRRAAEPGGTRYYLWTSVQSPKDGESPVSVGGLLPAKAWLNGEPLDPRAGSARMAAGGNPLLLRYDQIGRGWFVPGSKSGALTHDRPFSTDAKWIWWPGETEGVATRYFHREIDLTNAPASATMRITCDNGYSLVVNGKEIGSDDDWKRIRQYDLTPMMKSGKNAITVIARNAGGEGALIAELTLRDPRGGKTRIATDKLWLSSSSASGAKTPAREISSFDESLWATHPHGPPQLEAPSESPESHDRMPWNKDLAMRWFNDRDRFVLDTRSQVERPAGWYRFVAPPGLFSLHIPTSGKIKLWVDGRELPVEGGGGSWHASLGEPARSPAVVAIRVDQKRGDYGGAAFSDFIRLRCTAGQIHLGDWSKSGVLETYSGGAWYRKTFEIPAGNTGATTTLDLGEVAASAEVRVNGQPAGIKAAPPWKLDISRFVKPGENRIAILVCNTLANHYVTIPTHYRGSTVSGLLGPVKIGISKRPR
jgi:hypothetical protein